MVTMPISDFEIPSEVSELICDSRSTDAAIYFYNGEWLENHSKMGSGIRVVSGGPEKTANIEIKGSASQRVAVIHLYGNRREAALQKPFSVSCVQNYDVSSEAHIVETHLALNSIEFTVQNAATFVVETGAQVTFGQTFWLGDEATSKNKVNLKLHQAASFSGFALNVGSSCLNNEIETDLSGKNSSCELHSLILATRRHRVNTISTVRHSVADTKSEQLIKSIVNEAGKVQFTGNIKIAKDAQKSNARQLSQTLLLSRGGEAITEPQLDVGADDVTATHGATIGQLDEEQLFYLMSRGLARNEARHVLALAYQREVFDRVSSGFVRGHLERIHSRLPAEMSAEFSDGERAL